MWRRGGNHGCSGGRVSNGGPCSARTVLGRRIPRYRRGHRTRPAPRWGFGRRALPIAQRGVAEQLVRELGERATIVCADLDRQLCLRRPVGRGAGMARQHRRAGQHAGAWIASPVADAS
jgi:hypothetical protein